MNTRTRTAPAVPAKAVATQISLPNTPPFSGASRHDSNARSGRDGRRRPAADFGPISRAEMREIVAEMIG